MAGYWPSSFFACLWTERKARSINSQKRTRSISSHLDRTNLVNKGFIIWLLVKFCLWDTAGSPERARWLHLARSGSQSQRAIWFILPARGASHIINRGYYMVVRRYELSLWVLKYSCLFAAFICENFLTHEKRDFITPSGHVKLDVYYYKHQWDTKPFHSRYVRHYSSTVTIHSNVDLFSCEDKLFSWVRYYVLKRKLIWYVTLTLK